MQSLVLYFIRKYKNELSKYGPTFMKKLLDTNVIDSQFIQEWFDKTHRLDKDSNLYDKRAEKKFRDLVTDFVAWMNSASTEQGNADAIATIKTGGEGSDNEQI